MSDEYERYTVWWQCAAETTFTSRSEMEGYILATLTYAGSSGREQAHRHVAGPDRGDGRIEEGTGRAGRTDQGRDQQSGVAANWMVTASGKNPDKLFRANGFGFR
jgi:hypothetical protein